MTAADPTLARSARFWGGLAPRYARMKIRDEEAWREKMRRTRAALPPNAAVFEFGCGTGSTALEHAPHVGSILATDVSEEMLAFGRARAAEAGVQNIEFRAGVIEDFPAEAQWDGVLALNILHLLQDPGAAIARAAAMLKPGGVLVASTACLADWGNFLRPVLWAGGKLGKLPYCRFMTEAELIALHERAGLAVEDRWQPSRRAATFTIARKAG